jgi:hypothetical protein
MLGQNSDHTGQRVLAPSFQPSLHESSTSDRGLATAMKLRISMPIHRGCGFVFLPHYHGHKATKALRSFKPYKSVTIGK